MEDTTDEVIEPYKEIDDDTLYERFFSTPGDRALFFEEDSIVEKDRIFPDELVLLNIRLRREEECFSITDRSQMWYNTVYVNFTDTQKQEFQDWYTAWLNAPETRVIPDKPDWLK
ncbi:MAG TPA: hypothetical protein VIL26_03990 [Clostridia bacterium]